MIICCMNVDSRISMLKKGVVCLVFAVKRLYVCWGSHGLYVPSVVQKVIIM